MILTFMLRFGRGRVWLPLFLLVLALDQGAKWALVSLLAHGRSVSVAGGLGHIELARNGFQGFGSNSAWVLPLTFIALVVAGRLYEGLAEMRYSMSRLGQLGCALLAGGLAGLAFDRLTRGYAVDFLAFGGGAFTYNLADIAAIASFGVFALRGAGMALAVWPRRAQIFRRLASELPRAT